MYNNSSCEDNKGLNNESIVSIVVSVCSMLASIGIFTYLKISSKFKDLQNSEVEINTSQEGSKKQTSIKIKLTNDENFEITSKSKENGNNDKSESIFEKIYDGIGKSGKNSGAEQSLISESQSKEVLITNFSSGIENNNAGDIIIANTRKGMIIHALNTFLKTIKIHNLEDQDDIVLISNNHSRASSIANNLVNNYNDIQEDPDVENSSIDNNDIHLNNLISKKVAIPHPTPKTSMKSKTLSKELISDDTFNNFSGGRTINAADSILLNPKQNEIDEFSFFGSRGYNSKSDAQVKYETLNNTAKNLTFGNKTTSRNEQHMNKEVHKLKSSTNFIDEKNNRSLSLLVPNDSFPKIEGEHNEDNAIESTTFSSNISAHYIEVSDNIDLNIIGNGSND